MSKSINVPKLRFKEFSGEWEEKKLGDCIQILTDYHANGSYERLKENVELLDEPNYAIMIRTTNLEQNDYIDNLIYITEEAYHYLKKSKVYEDDIIINKIANAGATYLMPKIEKPVSLGMNIFLLRANSTVDKKFLYSIVKWQEYKLKALSSGTSTKTITKDDVRGFKVNLPSKPEQKKISSFLTLFDTKVEQLTKKEGLLQQYKKGVMQKIFNQEIRFKADDGSEFCDWEEKKLGDLGTVITGKTPSTSNSEFWNGKIEFITPTDIEGSKYQTKTTRTVTQQSNMKILPIGTIVYTCIASIGKMSLSTLPSITNQQINSLIVNDKKYNNEFVYYALLKITPYIQSTQANTTLPIINKTEFSKFIINVPCIEEQTKIANFLSSIDSKIEQVQKQLNFIKEFKKSLLHQMFV